MNPRFLYTDLTSYSFTAIQPVNEDAAFPLTNLVDYDTESYWKGANTVVPQYLSIDMGSATARNFVALDGTNFGTLTSATMSLQAATSADFSSSLETVVLVSGSNDTPHVVPFTSVTKRFWRLKFDGVLAEKPRVGNIFIDEYLEFSSPYDFGFVSGDTSYNTTEGTSLSGRTRSCQWYASRNTWEFKFSLQTTAVATQFRTFQQTVQGRTRPFYFIDTDESVHYVHLDADYTPTIGHRPNRHNLEKLVLRQKELE